MFAASMRQCIPASVPPNAYYLDRFSTCADAALATHPDPSPFVGVPGRVVRSSRFAQPRSPVIMPLTPRASAARDETAHILLDLHGSSSPEESMFPPVPTSDVFRPPVPPVQSTYSPLTEVGLDVRSASSGSEYNIDTMLVSSPTLEPTPLGATDDPALLSVSSLQAICAAIQEPANERVAEPPPQPLPVPVLSPPVTQPATRSSTRLQREAESNIEGLRRISQTPQAAVDPGLLTLRNRTLTRNVHFAQPKPGSAFWKPATPSKRAPPKKPETNLEMETQTALSTASTTSHPDSTAGSTTEGAIDNPDKSAFSEAMDALASLVETDFFPAKSSSLLPRRNRQGSRPPGKSKSSASSNLSDGLKTKKTQGKGPPKKQGKKKRRPGYVRPIIIERQRTGDRLLDMLRRAPVPSGGSFRMASQAVSFPFTDRAERLRQWFGLKLVWPEDAPFPERKLWSTRRMRSDDLERLKETLSSGKVKLVLSDQALKKEPHRSNEYSAPVNDPPSTLRAVRAGVCRPVKPSSDPDERAPPARRPAPARAPSTRKKAIRKRYKDDSDSNTSMSSLPHSSSLSLSSISSILSDDDMDSDSAIDDEEDETQPTDPSRGTSSSISSLSSASEDMEVDVDQTDLVRAAHAPWQLRARKVVKRYQCS